MRKIEAGIPIPKDGRGHHGNQPRKYDFGKMKVGDSLYVGPSRTSAYWYRSKHPDFCFTVRPEGKGWRVWRVSARERKR